MIIFLVIILYVLHIFICRWLYIKIINIDNNWEFPVIAIVWFIPIAGILIHLIIYLGLNKDSNNWFIPKPKNKDLTG